MITPESMYMETDHWFRNKGQHETARLIRKVLKCSYNRQATIIDHKVPFEDRLDQQISKNIGLAARAVMKEDKTKRQDKRR